jgi:hypothetical protein
MCTYLSHCLITAHYPFHTCIAGVSSIVFPQMLPFVYELLNCKTTSWNPPLPHLYPLHVHQLKSFSVLAWIVITKYHRPCGFNSKNLYLIILNIVNKIKVLLGLDPCYWLCSLLVNGSSSLPCHGRERESFGFSSYKDTDLITGALPLWPLLIT